MSQKFFPIKTETACQLKWAWSSVYLNNGKTNSCHRTGLSNIDPDNFNNFHNTSQKIKEREDMLQGKWPVESCGYCKKIEDAGGVSDRLRQATIPNMSPKELETNPSETTVDPTIVEIFFNNTCNLGCLYCGEHLSSFIEAENRKWGYIQNIENKELGEKQLKKLLPAFWKWFEVGFVKLKRLHILGGEPFYQIEFDHILDMIEKHPNPNCELNIVTNLMVTREKLEKYINRFKHMISKKMVKRVDITCSIDCWGPEQEYVRYGLNLKQWEENFQYLLTHKWLVININQTLSPLTIKSMPELLHKLKSWREKRPVGHFFAEVSPGPSYMIPSILGGEIFLNDFEKILQLLPTNNEQDLITRDYMKGIFNRIAKSNANIEEMKKLKIYLIEKDKRRNTNYNTVFPWLSDYLDRIL